MLRAWPLLALIACAGPDREGPDGDRPRTVADWEIPAGATDEEVLDHVLLDPQLQRFEIELGDAQVEDLRELPYEWVAGDLIWNGMRFEGVGIRLKGNGSFQTIDERPSLKIEFDKYRPGLDFFGLDVLVLNNMTSDPTKYRERVAYDLYRAMGVPAPRAAHAEVVINGEVRGIYTHMEDIDDRMLAHWFADPSGPLYELFDVVLRPEDIGRFEHESGPDDRTVLAGAADALLLDREDAIVAVEAFVDMDAFLTYYATSGVIGQFDAWPFNNPTDDVHLYVDPETQRIHPVPHGLDESQADRFRHVGIPGASLLGQACYFTPDCKAALARKSWEAWDEAQRIDVVGRSFGYYQVLADYGADRGLPLEAAQAFFDEYQTHEQFWVTREERLLENLGPR